MSLAILAALAVVRPPEARAAEVKVAIPQQPLADALDAFAKATGYQLVYRAELAMGLESGRVEPPLPTTEAIRQLLYGTGLQFQFVNDRTITIFKAEGSWPQPRSHSATEVVSPDVQSGNDGGGAQSATSAGSLVRGEQKVIEQGFLSRLAAVLGICVSAASSSPACAQAASAEAALQVQEVTVTGSRVITSGNESPIPVTVVGATELQAASPGTIYEALQAVPALLGPPNQGGQGPGPQAVLNLRGLGGARNLILFDGHRLAPTTAAAGVDTNLIPTMLLKRVDIVTGGASAVYGSDAVSGVVNYVIDNEFNGLKLVASGGQTTYNDGDRYNVGIAYGARLFAGRGHAEFSYQRNYDPGIESRFSRDWGRGLWSMQGSVVGSTASAGTVANPWILYKDTRISVTTFGGLVNTGPLAGLQFKENGVLSPFVHGALTGSLQAEVGGDGGYYTTYSAYGIQNLDQGFGRFDFEFTENVKGYAELLAATALNESSNANFELRTRAIGYNNAFLSTVQAPYSATVAAQRAANPNGTFNFSRIFTPDQIPAPINSSRGTQFVALAGLQGSWNGYRWDLGYEHSDFTAKSRNPNNISNPRLWAALNAVVNPANGSIVCNAALVNPALYGDCMPLNPFGPSATNAQALNYIRGSTGSETGYLMDDVTFSIAGSPLDAWAGPIEMALSGELRRLSYEVKGNVGTALVNCTGIQFNCVSNTSFFVGGNTTSFPKATQDVKEAAFEAQVPLLRDVKLVESLDLNTALRFTNYSTSGSVWTWKLGATWAMNPDLKLRLTRSRDIRAPSLTNLFAPLSTATQNITDIHTGGTGNVISISQGNPNLVPENADTVTAGYVWTPQFVEGLSVSMDYYRIKIADALNGVSPALPPAQTACEASNGASTVCDLYVRPFPFSDRSAANFPTAILNQTLNTGGFLTYGLDSEFSYTRQLAGRPLRTRLLLNYQPHLIYDQGPAGKLDLGGAGDGAPGLYYTPSVKGMLQLNYDVIEHLAGTVQVRYRNSVKQNGSPLIFFAMGKLAEVWYTDLNLNYKFKAGGGGMEAFLNVRNLWNQQPPPYAVVGGASQIGSLGGYMVGDDTLGRFYTVGVRYAL